MSVTIQQLQASLDTAYATLSQLELEIASSGKGDRNSANRRLQDLHEHIDWLENKIRQMGGTLPQDEVSDGGCGSATVRFVEAP